MLNAHRCLFFLHICSFLMSYDSSDISLGDIETIILYNLDCQSREMHSFLIKLFILSFVYWDPFLILKDSLITNEAFHLAFWYLFYSATFMFLGQPGICQFTSSNFHIIPYWSPWSSPVEKRFLSLTPENFWTLFSLVIQAIPHQDSEIRCLKLHTGNICYSSSKEDQKFIKRICHVKTLSHLTNQ